MVRPLAVATVVCGGPRSRNGSSPKQAIPRSDRRRYGLRTSVRRVLGSAKKAYLAYVEEAQPSITFGLTGQHKVFQFRDEILGTLDEPGAVDAFVNVLLDRIAASGDDPDVADAMVGTWTLFSALVFAYRRDLIGELKEVKERYDL